MYTVTQRANSYTQPYGGFIPVSALKQTAYQDKWKLNRQENVHGMYVGMAVDYLTRYKLTGAACASFDISMKGALAHLDMTKDMETYYMADDLFEAARRGDTAAAIKLTAFDDVYRRGNLHIEHLDPDGATVENVEIMTERSVKFIRSCGNKIYPGLDFCGAYTTTVINGDCDYVTDLALIDLKVLRGEITPQYTLQILMYYLLGKDSVHEEIFRKVRWLAFFNPRKNTAYYINVADIPSEILQTVRRDVIGA